MRKFTFRFSGDLQSPMHFKTFKNNLKISLAKSFIAFLTLLSLRNCHRLGNVIGRLLVMFPNRSRHVTTTNIQLCFPNMKTKQQQKLIKKSLIETSKTLVEANPMWRWKKDKLFKLIKNVHGENLIQEALDEQNGVILALPHLGNWELLALYCSSKYPTTTMYQKPKIPQFDELIKDGRERFGAKLVPADSEGIRAMLKALRKNELICVLPDQEPKEGKGVFSPFFNLQAYSMTLISRFANKTDAKVFIAYSKRLAQGEGYEIHFSPLDKMKVGSLEESVTYLNAEMEKCIREIPEQYQWSYKRFRKQPEIKDKRIIGKDFYNFT